MNDKRIHSSAGGDFAQRIANTCSTDPDRLVVSRYR